MKNKKKDIPCLIVFILTAVGGLVNIIRNEVFEIIFVYVMMSSFWIVLSYFHYSFAKFKNRQHKTFNEQNPSGDNEPSYYRMISQKYTAWLMFVMAMVIAVIAGIF